MSINKKNWLILITGIIIVIALIYQFGFRYEYGKLPNGVQIKVDKLTGKRYIFTMVGWKDITPAKPKIKQSDNSINAPETPHNFDFSTTSPTPLQTPSQEESKVDYYALIEQKCERAINLVKSETTNLSGNYYTWEAAMKILAQEYPGDVEVVGWEALPVVIDNQGKTVVHSLKTIKNVIESKEIIMINIDSPKIITKEYLAKINLFLVSYTVREKEKNGYGRPKGLFWEVYLDDKVVRKITGNIELEKKYGFARTE